MSEKIQTETERLVSARGTLRGVWVAYRDEHDYIDAYDVDVRKALEVALDEIDLALLRLDDVDIRFEYRDGNENDSQ